MKKRPKVKGRFSIFDNGNTLRARSSQYSREPPRAVKATLKAAKAGLDNAGTPPAVATAPRVALAHFFLSGGVFLVAFLLRSWSGLCSFRLPVAFSFWLGPLLLSWSFCRRPFPVAFSRRPSLVAFFCGPVSFGFGLLCRPAFRSSLACLPSFRSRGVPFSWLPLRPLLWLLPFLVALRWCSASSSFLLAFRAFLPSVRSLFSPLSGLFVLPRLFSAGFFFSLTETVLKVPTCE